MPGFDRWRRACASVLDQPLSRQGQSSYSCGSARRDSSPRWLAASKVEANEAASSEPAQGSSATSPRRGGNWGLGWLTGQGAASASSSSTAIAASQDNSKTEIAQTKQQLEEDDWKDHPETDQERRQREMVEQWKNELFRTSPMIRFMTKHLDIVSCDPLATIKSTTDDQGEGEPAIVFRTCDPNRAGGFAPGDPPSQSQILICTNRMMSKKHLEHTLSHEMVHWFDHCRFHVDWNDIRHVACSEVRAASLSGDCSWSREFTRREYAFTKQHQACARRRAILSVRAHPNCKDQAEAERAVDEVWKGCFADTRPFDELY